MTIQVHKLHIEGLLHIELKVFGDARGFFVERFSARTFQHSGIPTNFVQDNHSRSEPGVLRGLHYQYNPDQGKLVGVVRGKIWDVAVDLRHKSPTYGKHYAVELSSEKGNLLWIPGGFAHGFCVIGSEPADVLYKVTEYYDPHKEGGISALDKELNIAWPMKSPKLSERDKKLCHFSDYKVTPIF